MLRGRFTESPCKSGFVLVTDILALPPPQAAPFPSSYRNQQNGEQNPYKQKEKTHSSLSARLTSGGWAVMFSFLSFERYFLVVHATAPPLDWVGDPFSHLPLSFMVAPPAWRAGLGARGSELEDGLGWGDKEKFLYSSLQEAFRVWGPFDHPLGEDAVPRVIEGYPARGEVRSVVEEACRESVSVFFGAQEDTKSGLARLARVRGAPRLEETREEEVMLLRGQREVPMEQIHTF